MVWLDSILAYLSPSILITNPQWLEKWRRQQKEQFLRYAGFFFLVVALGYIANYFFFDIPMELQPEEFWLQFRVSMAAMAIICSAFYLSPLTRIRGYKIPAVIACSIMSYTQAWVTVWFSPDAWLFFYIFVMTCTLFLGFSVIGSIVYCVAMALLGAPVLIQAGISPEYITSSTIVTIAFTVIMQRSSLAEVRNFLLSEENIANQQKITEISNEFAERIESFIPRVIARRMSTYIEEGMSVVESSIEALKARKKDIACLFTDIRGFTQGSKDLDQFIVESVMPEVTACSSEIEELGGIPRKVGDLIFAYFDENSIHMNVIRAIAAGIAVARLNDAMNTSQSQVIINRYILISAGEAMVGNFGGLDSSVEITALGTPVNFLSRVDDLTKEPALANSLNSGDLVVSERVRDLVTEASIELPFELLDLDKLALSIRDFPETRKLYKLSPTPRIWDQITSIRSDDDHE